MDRLSSALTRWETSQAESADVLSELTALLRDPTSVPKKSEAPWPSSPGSHNLQPRYNSKSHSGRFSVFKEGAAREVETSVRIERIFNVDTLEQSFSAQVNITQTWHLPPDEVAPLPSEDDGDWIPDWTPKLRFLNLLEERYSHVQYGTFERDGRRWVVAESEHLVTLSEALELKAFPLDCQDLNVQIMSRMPAENIIWRPRTDQETISVNSNGCLLNDFALMHQIPFTWNMFVGQRAKDQKRCSQIDIKVKVRRKSFYYILNVSGVMFIICSFILTSWSMHPGDIEGRFSVDFQLVLTAVAFKLVSSGMLPPVSYITLMDLYVIVGFFFLAAVTLTHAALPSLYISKMDVSALTLPPLSFDNEDEFIAGDMVSFYLFVTGWILFNLGYALYARRMKHKMFEDFMEQALKENKDNDLSSDEVILKD